MKWHFSLRVLMLACALAPILLWIAFAFVDDNVTDYDVPDPQNAGSFHP